MLASTLADSRAVSNAYTLNGLPSQKHLAAALSVGSVSVLAKEPHR